MSGDAVGDLMLDLVTIGGYAVKMCLEVIVRAPRRGQAWLRLVCAVLFTFWSATAAAQTLAVPDESERRLPENQLGQPNRARNSQVDRYRNGSDWISVERQQQKAPAGSGLTPVVLRGGGHVFHGQIDKHAI